MSKTFKDKRENKRENRFSRKKFLENKENKKRNSNFTSDSIEEILDEAEREVYENIIFNEQFEDMGIPQ